MNRFVSLVLLGLCLQLAAINASKAPLPALTFELRSRTPGDLRDVMVQVLQTSREHLNGRFSTHFTETLGEGSFGVLDLSVSSFDTSARRRLQDDAITITYNGVATFNTDPPPDADEIKETTTDAFKGDARTEFVDALLLSGNDFLANLSYLVVGISGVVVANEDLSHRTPPPTGSSTKTQYYLIGAVAAAAVGVVIAVGILIYTCHLKNDEFNGLPDKGPKDDSNDLDIEMKSTRSPSPERSIVSQESSKFTYNPRGISFSVKSTDSGTLPSQFSGLQVDVSEPVNVEAWQKNTISPITPAPFGADISAIEEDKRDLSCVQEGDSNEEKSSAYLSRNTSSSNYLSRNSLGYLDRSAAPPTRSATLGASPMYSDDDSNKMSYHDDSSSDVIRDLKNLSVQIQKRRSGHR